MRANGERDSSGTFSYKVDEIDCSVMDELPPEIRDEVRAWSSEEQLNRVQIANERRCSSGGDGERIGERWSYKMEDIDPGVMDELPPEIRAEIQAWLRPQKPAKRGKQGSSIIHYFLPMKNK